MRTNKTTKRARRAVRVPARLGRDVKVGADMPRCVTCGQPLARLPRFLGAARGLDRGFQCQRCFYANAAPAPGTDVIASERTRWLTGVLSAPGEAPPPRPSESED